MSQGAKRVAVHWFEAINLTIGYHCTCHYVHIFQPVQNMFIKQKDKAVVVGLQDWIKCKIF